MRFRLKHNGQMCFESEIYLIDSVISVAKMMEESVNLRLELHFSQNSQILLCSSTCRRQTILFAVLSFWKLTNLDLDFSVHVNSLDWHMSENPVGNSWFSIHYIYYYFPQCRHNYAKGFWAVLSGNKDKSCPESVPELAYLLSSLHSTMCLKLFT